MKGLRCLSTLQRTQEHTGFAAINTITKTETRKKPLSIIREDVWNEKRNTL